MAAAKSDVTVARLLKLGTYKCAVGFIDEKIPLVDVTLEALVRTSTRLCVCWWVLALLWRRFLLSHGRLLRVTGDR